MKQRNKKSEYSFWRTLKCQPEKRTLRMSTKLRLTNVYCCWPGKVHDATIFLQSPLFEEGLCGSWHTLADSVYPKLNWILSPFRDNCHLIRAQKRFNQVHASIRSTTERAFGLLKDRFTRLKHLDDRDIQTMSLQIYCLKLTGCGSPVWTAPLMWFPSVDRTLDVVPQCGPHPGCGSPVWTAPWMWFPSMDRTLLTKSTRER